MPCAAINARTACPCLVPVAQSEPLSPTRPATQRFLLRRKAPLTTCQAPRTLCVQRAQPSHHKLLYVAFNSHTGAVVRMLSIVPGLDRVGPMTVAPPVMCQPPLRLVSHGLLGCVCLEGCVLHTCWPQYTVKSRMLVIWLQKNTRARDAWRMPAAPSPCMQPCHALR